MLPITTMINSLLFWTLCAVFFISVRSKPATLKYGDLIYANKRSLSILFSCSSRIQVRTTCPMRTACDFPVFDWIRQCKLLLCCRQKVIFMNCQTLLSRFHFDVITDRRVHHEKLRRQTTFFKAALKSYDRRFVEA